MAWKIEFSEEARKTLRKIDRATAQRIVGFMSGRVAPLDNPRSLGTALKGDRYAGKWRYRVGDYRIIAEIKDHVVTVVVVDIGHRREIYR